MIFNLNLDWKAPVLLTGALLLGACSFGQSKKGIGQLFNSQE